MIDHNVMRLHIAVHDALAVTVVKRLEELVNVKPDIDIVELGIQTPEVRVVDILEDERRSFTLFGTKPVSTGVAETLLLGA